jgi:hypothetical protein
MADQMQATPRSYIAALLSDAINSGVGYMKSPQRTQQLQGLGRLLESTGIPYAVESLSYDPSGRGLFTGAGGLGGTTRMRPEALEAAMTVAPMVGPTARLAGRGLMAAGKAGEQLAERVVPKVMARGGLPAELLQGMSRGTVSPLDVYHGTPHRFPPTANNPLGEFDASKIGTGEGAQVYGHGIYMAENPAVAQGYKDTLAYKAFDLQPEAEKLGLNLPAGTRGEFIRQVKADKPPEILARQLQNANIEARSLPQEKLTELFRAYQEKGGGNLYKADLPDEQIAKMLDWDKPLSQQDVLKAFNPRIVDDSTRFDKAFSIEAVVSIGNGNRKVVPITKIFKSPEEAQAALEKMTGADLYRHLSESPMPAGASSFLRDAGIPGIKYLDQGSRQPGTASMTQAQLDTRINILKKDIDSGLGDQERMKQILASMEQERALHTNLTRNFVVFPGEEQNMRILERNGQPVASPFYQDPFPDTAR